MERVIILGALVLAAHAGPIQQFSIDTSCSKTCIASDKFNYVPGKTYEFQYDTEVRTSVQGSSEDHAGVHMSATVHMEILSKCELVMRLTDVSLEEYDPLELVMKPQRSGTFSQALERYPLRISFQDGNIEELCLVAEEPQWVMNVKRGVLSVFQNNFVDGQENSTLTETDIAGNCHTQYTTGETGWYSKTIKKSKNLLSCTERNGFNTAIQGVPYSADSSIQSLPIIKSTHECEHQIDKQSNHLTSATCREQHMFRPFSRSDSGAVTHSTQQLKLIKQTIGTRPTVPVLKKASMKFEHADNGDMEEKTRKELERKLLEICEGTKMGVNSDTPKLFSDLVYIVRSVDAATLQDSYERIQNGAVCSENKERVSKFLLDALPVAGTSASLKVMTDLLTRKVVTGLEASMWLTSLSFIKNPTQDMLMQVKPLVNMVENEEKALLSVGSLIHSYCTSSGVCEQDTAVRGLISAMVSKIANGCKVKDETFKSSLIALRAIGNAGFAYGAIPTLKACMSFPQNPTEIRLSAIEAFRRMPCDADQAEIMSIFLDTNEDSEIRIAAYKALMECPADEVIDRIKKTLETEEVNQVGSYVWSHLTNLMETSDRHKQYIRDILEDEELKKEFDLDKRKFSRNYEGSFFIEQLNTGAKAEGDLIWSQKSFVPRSAMLNLTVDLFGHSVNLLELGGRAEGLEYFMESFFGPNGYFSENSADEPVGIPKSKMIHPSKMRKMDSRFSQKLDQLRAAMYMRVFGNELRYINIRGLDSLLSGSNFNVLEMLIQLSKNNDYTFTHSTMFLDSSMIIPTGSGFPMNLTVNGTATVDLKLKGKMDLRSPPAVDIEGLIQPSAAIDISGMMSVDAYVTKSGVKMISTMHTNTALMGKLKVSGDSVFTAEYEMPQPRMDIISVKSSFFTIHNNLEKEQKMITDNQQRKVLCSPYQLVTVTGLELCGELQYPNASLKSNAPYFPMTGPVTAGVYLYNRDTHKKYKMEARSVHTTKSNIIHFSFNTPDSKTDRHVAIEVNLDKKAKTLDMTLTSPWKKAYFQGSLTNEQFLKSLTGKMNLGGSQAYAINAQMKKERVGNAHKYVPSLEITLPNKDPYTASGMFMYNGNRQFDVELMTNRITQKPIKTTATVYNRPNFQGLKGNLLLGDKDEYSIDISNTRKLDKKKVLFKPLVSLRSPTQEVFAFGGTAQYVYGKKVNYNLVLDKIVAKKITLKGFLQKLVRKRNRVLYRNRINFGSSPMDFALDAKLDNRNYKTIATDIDFTYVIRRVARNNIKLVSKINNLSSSQLLNGKSSLTLSVKRNPELNVKMIGNINHNAKHTEADLDVRYGDATFKDENKHVEVSLESNRDFKSYTEASADGQLKFRHTGQGLNMVLKGNHKHDTSDLDSSVFMKFGKGEPIESTLRLSDKTSALLDVSGIFTLSYPGKYIVINETIQQPEQNKYVSSFNGQLRKGQKNSVVTSFTRTSPDGGKFDADISLHNEVPYHFDAEWSTEPTEFFTKVTYERNSKHYSGSITSVTIPTLSRLVTDIELPERRIKLAMEGRPQSDVWSGIAELKWNADRDESKRVTVSGWLEPLEPNRVNGSITLYYPTRTLTLNAHNIIGAKYTSHADFAWEKNKKIDVDFIYGSASKGGTKKIISQAKLTTPFVQLKSVSVDITHGDDSEEYKTEVDLRLAPHTVAVTTIIRKPLSFRTVVGSVEAQTSFRPVKKLKLDINHKLSSSLASSAKLTWNKKFVQAAITLINQTKHNKMAFKGDIDMKSSFPWMKKGRITLAHNNDGISFVTNGDFLRNRKKYGFASEITHQPRENGLDNTGSITLKCPHGNAQTQWSHRNSWSDIATVFSTRWNSGRKQTEEIMIKVNGKEALESSAGTMDASIEIITPFAPLKDIQLQLRHVHRNWHYWGFTSFSNSSLNLFKEKKNIASIEALYKPNRRDFDSHLLVSIPGLDVDSGIKITAKDSTRSEESFIKFDVVITPSISTSLLLKAMLNDSLHSAVEFKSSVPGYKEIIYTFDADVDKFMNQHQLSIVRKLHYGEGKVIEIATKLSLDGQHKRGLLIIKSPYESLKKFEGNVILSGDRYTHTFESYSESFLMDSYIEVLPHFDKISALVTWNTTDKWLFSRVHVDTPFPEVPNIEANVNYKDTSDLMQTIVRLDYDSTPLLNVNVRNDRADESIYDMSLKMSAPISSELTYRGNLANFKSKAEVGLPSERQPYGLNVNFMTDNKIEGSVTIAIPSRRDINAYFSHSGSVTNFASHAEILHNRKNEFLSDFSFSCDGHKPLYVTGSATMKAELLSAEEYGLEFHHEGWSENFKSHAEFSTFGLGKSEADVSFDRRNDIDGEFSLKSPLMKNIVSSFNLHTSTDYLQAKADYKYGGKKLVNFITTIDAKDTFVGELSLSNPFTEDIRAMTRASGRLEKFFVYAEGSFGIYKSDIELSSSIAPHDIQQTVTIKATGMADITGELSYNGLGDSVRSHAQISIGEQKHRVDASLNKNRDIEGDFALTTPLFKPLSSSFNFQGVKTNFRSHWELIIGIDKSEVDASFSMSPKLMGSFNIRTPYCTDISSEFDHTGIFPDVVSQAKLGYGGKQQFSVRTSLSTDSGLSGSISVETPFEDFENLQLTASHEGSLQSFRCHAETVVNGDKTEADVFYNSVGRFEGLASVKSHLFQDMSVGFEHSGSHTSFKSHAEYTIGFTKTEVDISVDIADEIDISLRLRLPERNEIQATFNHRGTVEDFTCHAVYTEGFTKDEMKLNFRNSDNPVMEFIVSSPVMSLNVNHAGQLNKFKTHGDVTFDGQKREVDISFVLSEILNGSIVLTAPMFSFKVNQNGNLGHFVSNIELVNDYNRYAYEARLETKDRIDARININTPIEGYETVKAVYTHNGKIDNFKCHGELSLPDSLSVGDLKVNLDTAFEGSLSLSSPPIPNINAEFDHSRTRTFYKSHAELSIDDDVMAGVTVSLDHSSGLEGELHVMTPFNGYRNIRSSGKYSGSVKSFSMHQEVLVGTDKHEIDLSYDSKPKYIGSLTIRTPVLPEIDADFDYMGKFSKFNAGSKLLIDGEKKFGLTGSVNIEDGVSVDFDITTPFENFTSISGQLTKTGDKSDISTNAHLSVEEKNIIKTSTQLLNDEKTSASVSVESAYFEPVKANVAYEGTIKDFSSSADISLSGEKWLETTIKCAVTPISLKSSASFNNMAAAINYDGSLKNFKSHAEVGFHDDAWAADVAVSSEKNVDASFSLSFPDREVITGKLTHVQKYKRVETHAEVQLDSDNKYEFDSSLNWRRAAEATFGFKTPIENYKDNSLTFRHDGQFPNTKTSAQLSYPKNDISFSFDLNHADSTTGHLTLALPVEGWEHVDVSFFREGSLPNFKSGGKISYTTGKEIEMSIEHSQFGTMEIFSAHLMSPFTDEINLSFNHTGGSANFVNNIGLSMGQDLSISMENSLKTGPEYISYLYTSKGLMSGESFTDKISFNHEGNLQKFKTDALVSINGKFAEMQASFQLEPAIEGSVSLQSSVEALQDIKTGFAYSGYQHGFMSNGMLQFSPTDKIEGNVEFTSHEWRRMVADIDLRTPYNGYTVNKLRYEHTGDLDSFQCNGEIILDKKKMSGIVSGSKSPLSLTINIDTPFEDFEKLTFNGNLKQDRRGRYSSRVEASWNPNKQVVLDGSFSALRMNQYVEGSLSLSSPFEKLRRLSVDATHQQRSDKYTEILKVSYNGDSLVDVELDHSLSSPHKSAVLTVRAPRSMKFEVEGEFSVECVDVEINTDWNVVDPSSHMHIVAGYDFRPMISEKTIKFKLTGADRLVSYSGSLDDTHSKSDFAWGTSSTQMIGYDITYDRNDPKAKIILPTRTLEVSASKRGRVTEGSVMWDADNDLTKKVGFRSVIVPSHDSVRADLTLMLPSLGKNVQVDSEMVVNRGRIIFDAKTELSYSSDERKKLVFMSKLEDISSGSYSKNYSFSFGLSHPFSTTGIKMASHVGKAENELTGSLGLEYLTSQRQTKTFQISGKIHKLKKTVFFELLSPMKAIRISGTAQTNDQYQVSLLNVYDQRQPLNTVFTMDPVKRTISLNMNYDLDNPSDEVHVTAGYVNSSAVAAEMYHVTGNVKVTDVLVAMRLNNSQLIHSRLHWRPELMADLRMYLKEKSVASSQRLSKTMETMTHEFDREMVQKLRLIYESLEELVGEAAMNKIDEVISPVLTAILEGIDDVTDDVVWILSEQVRQLANKTRTAYQDLNIMKKIPSMNEISNAGIVKFARMTSSASQPLVKSTSYVIGMFHDKVKSIPSRVSDTLKYGVGNILPNTISQQVSDANHYWELEDNMANLLDSILLWLDAEIMEQSKILENFLLKSVTSPFTVYGPAHGEIQAEFHLPISLKSLDTLPVVNFRLGRYMQNIISSLPQVGQLNSYIPDFSGEMLPPFSAHASIQNGHKITTFDGFDYDLPLDCTFVLTKDFMDGNFSLILGNDGETSLTVLSKGKQISLKLSGEVLVNGKPVDLPYMHNNLTVTSPVDGQILVNGAGSFNVSWDTADDYIVVTLNGWYYGKTGGLLGVYDNEPSNDLMTPFRKVIDNTNRFAATWDVGRTACR